jgi:hypothetical protein
VSRKKSPANFGSLGFLFLGHWRGAGGACPDNMGFGGCGRVPRVDLAGGLQLSGDGVLVK